MWIRETMVIAVAIEFYTFNRMFSILHKANKCCFDCVFYAFVWGVRNAAKLDLHKYELFGYVHRGKLGS